MSYHNIYHIPLLNDLHNWFPELLYNPLRFQSVQDILGYIIQIANENAYQNGQQRYNSFRYHMGHAQPYLNTPVRPESASIHAPAPALAPAPAPPDPAPSFAPSFARVRQNVNNEQSATASSSSNQIPNIFDMLYRYGDEEHLMESEEPLREVHISHVSMPSSGTNVPHNILSSILGQVIYGRRDTSAMQNFLSQSVIVRPTEEQINTNTTLSTAIRTQDDNCAICQDEIEEDQEMRSINYCHHLFHKHCIDTWFQTNVKCPSCRHDIRE